MYDIDELNSVDGSIKSTTSRLTYYSYRSMNSRATYVSVRRRSLEYTRLKEEIKCLKLEIVYAKAKAKERRSHMDLISTSSSSASAEREYRERELRSQVEKMKKEAHRERLTAYHLKVKSEKDKSRLSQEIQRLQRVHMFNNKEIGRLMALRKEQTETITNLKKKLRKT